LVDKTKVKDKCIEEEKVLKLSIVKNGDTVVNEETIDSNIEWLSDIKAGNTGSIYFLYQTEKFSDRKKINLVNVDEKLTINKEFYTETFDSKITVSFEVLSSGKIIVLYARDAELFYDSVSAAGKPCGDRNKIPIPGQTAALEILETSNSGNGNILICYSFEQTDDDGGVSTMERSITHQIDPQCVIE
jgi:hypothetical protein